jgi:GNAT superfamily N-acetyltransferase
LYVLYVHGTDHGTGAGRGLLEAVIDPAEPTVLWVVDPNPRAQAFYRKHGFVPDGTVKVEDGLRQVRLVCGLPAVEVLEPGAKTLGHG